MFVWVFHRVSGLILIVLMGFKIITGYGILGRYGEHSIESMRVLHRAPSLELLLAALFAYHAMYGLRTCLVDLGVRHEKTLFWGATILGTAIFLLIAWLLILPKFGA